MQESLSEAMPESPSGEPQTSFSPLATAALAVLTRFSYSAAKVLLRSGCHLSTQASLMVESADGGQAERKSFNPWGLHCHQAHLTRLCSEYPEDKRHHILTALAPVRNP